MGLFDKIRGLGRGYVTALVLKKAAAGDFGPVPKWIYWHLREIKTDVGIVLAAVAGIIMALDKSGACALASTYWTWVHCEVWAATVEHWSVAASAFFLYLGQVDGGLHLDAPDTADPVAQKAG